ncbi:serine hydroxymethyltransferase mitochondrial-like, partial [Trifolium medium]|nr:serine hydroxymethyltransferase mitochondrial-like [Trifolium medium]
TCFGITIDLIDYDMLEKTATNFRPKVIVACASAYSPDLDYPRIRKSMRGPGGGMIFFKKGFMHGIDMESAFYIGVFPGLLVNLEYPLIISFLTLLIEKVCEYAPME